MEHSSKTCRQLWGGLLLAMLLVVMCLGPVLAEPANDRSWARVTENDNVIKIETDKIEAAIPKKNPNCWMTGLEKQSFLDKTSGFREAGDGLCLADWLLEPGSDEAWREQLKATDHYLFNNSYHGKRAKHMLEGPQLSNGAKPVHPEIIRGKDFVAVKAVYRYQYAAPSRKAGSTLTQVFVFPEGKRYFFAMDRIDSVNDSDAMFLRSDMPGSLRHEHGETFSEIYLSYLGGPEGLRIPSAEFEHVFSPDEKFNYWRDTNTMPAHFFRAYRLRDPKTGKQGPWLAGITLDPSAVYEAWCNQRPGIVILIEECGGRPIKAGQSFSTAFVVGFFDTIDEIHSVCDRYKGCTTLSADDSGWRIENPCASAAPQRLLTNSIGMTMSLIPAGEFMMGNRHREEQERELYSKYDPSVTSDSFRDEYPCHRVRITKPFYMGRFHVTVGQFRRFVDESGYKTESERNNRGSFGFDGKSWKEKPEYTWRIPGFAQGDDHPVVAISWNDAMAFCQWLGRKEGDIYRLPTEAEWEYACRAGTTTRYSCGDDPENLVQVSNVGDASAKAKFPNATSTIHAGDGYVFTSPVGSFRPNAFGIYDMHGNAWQWCADRYGRQYYGLSPADDPPGPSTGELRVTRGGSWYLGPVSARSSKRYGGAPDARYGDQGFRVVKSL